MDDRSIIIADRDTEYLRQVADFFRKEGYQVETTDSAVHVLCSILEKQTPVLLLGSDFDKKVSSANLIQLLKKCNRHLDIIMVSDEMPLPLARKIRQEGIFYHALKPAVPGDTEELGLAVKCAFNGLRTSNQLQRQQLPQTHPVFFESNEYLQLQSQQVPQSQPALFDSTENEQPDKEDFLQAVTWFISIFAVIFGSTYLTLAAGKHEGADGSHLAIWIFLGMCALIIVTQLLPIFRTKASGEKVAVLKPVELAGEGAEQESAHFDGK
jgi:FixJ family two-component response regulator